MYNQIYSNKRKSWILMIVVFLLVGVVAYAIQVVYGFGYELTIIALMFALISNLYAYYRGDQMVLRLNGAKPITREDNPYVYRLVENLAISAGMPMPKIYIIDDPAMNAFATGRDPNHASIAFTQGIIDNLENEELEGVAAHELAHIKNYDIRLMTVVAVLIGVIMVLVDLAWRMSFFGGSRRDERGGAGVLAIVGLLLIILAPLIGKLIQLAISRKREYLADASGALLTRYPEGLANALEKIAAQSRPMKKVNHGTAHLFFSNPFGPEARKSINRFFSTHPPIEDRIAKLRQMAYLK